MCMYIHMYTCIYILYIHVHRSYTFVCVYIPLYIYTTEDYLGHSKYPDNFLTNRKLVKDVCVYWE